MVIIYHITIFIWWFLQIRVIGRVADVTTDPGGSTTYELCDAKADESRTAKRFTVIRYEGTDVWNNNLLNLKI